AMLFAVVPERDTARRKRRIEAPQHLSCNRSRGSVAHISYITRLSNRGKQVATRHPRMHGKVEGATGRCAVRGCRAPGEYRAPVQPANFDGPGVYRLLCLDHVREHNAKYNFFDGMSP